MLLEAGEGALPAASDLPGGAPLEAAVLGPPGNACTSGSLKSIPSNKAPRAPQVAEELSNRVLSALEGTDRHQWSQEQLRAWLCAQGGATGCLLAAPFGESGMDGKLAFGGAVPLPLDSSKAKELDAWEVVQWSYAMHLRSAAGSPGPYLELAVATARSFARLHPEWFAKAAASGMQEVLEVRPVLLCLMSVRLCWPW